MSEAHGRLGPVPGGWVGTLDPIGQQTGRARDPLRLGSIKLWGKLGKSEIFDGWPVNIVNLLNRFFTSKIQSSKPFERVQGWWKIRFIFIGNWQNMWCLHFLVMDYKTMLNHIQPLVMGKLVFLALFAPWETLGSCQFFLGWPGTPDCCHWKYPAVGYVGTEPLGKFVL